jgi:hypothetical protein
MGSDVLPNLIQGKPKPLIERTAFSMVGATDRGASRRRLLELCAKASRVGLPRPI